MRIAIIGTGDMGILHARLFSREHEVVCFNPGKERRLRLIKSVRDNGLSNVAVPGSISAALKGSRVVILLPPVRAMRDVARMIKSHLEPGATIVVGASVMLPAARSLLEGVPDRRINIIGMHCLFGPTEKRSFASDSIAAVKIRTTDPAMRDVKRLFGTAFSSREGRVHIIDIRPGRGRHGRLSASDEHDRIMADTQVVTHIGFQSMGTAWMRAGISPWENAIYKNGIDNAKTLMMLRIFSGKMHVYEALAMQNVHAKRQVAQYAKSVGELLRMMEQGDEVQFRARLEMDREFLRANGIVGIPMRASDVLKGSRHAERHAKPNSHLSLLAMADSWRVLGTDMHNDIMCSTPPFLVRRLIVGLAFEEPTFERSINAAMSSGEIKGHDAVFAGSVRDWTSAVASRNIDAYERLFTGTRDFFKDRLERGRKDSEKLISLLEASG